MMETLGSYPARTTMFTFKDLQFEPHSIMTADAIQAIMEFDNGYGVIRGHYFYCSENTYEVAILKDGDICYDITDDVLGYQTKDQVTKIMKKLQTYEKDSEIPSTV